MIVESIFNDMVEGIVFLGIFTQPLQEMKFTCYAPLLITKYCYFPFFNKVCFSPLTGTCSGQASP